MKQKNINHEKNCMLSTLTNINCEKKSMAVYSELFAMTIQSTADSNVSSSSTAIWEFENQLNTAYIGSRDN
jgi:hypothetical protein